MTYHLTGFISAAIFLLTIGGLRAQLRLLAERRRSPNGRAPGSERPSAVLSLNQFVSSFLAFFSFFLYGACLPRFNHYLVWPRLAATLLTLVVLYEIMADRKERPARAAFWGCLTLLLAAPAVLWRQPRNLPTGRIASATLIVVMTVVLAQGYLHQVVCIWRSGQTGAVSLRLHQFFFLKDVATIAFALAMGWSDGWPLLLLSTVSAATKLATIWCFHWAKSSPAARARREKCPPPPETFSAL